ncbi:MAG TPA: alkaline phosphatase PhoX [Longimicrobium sp.]
MGGRFNRGAAGAALLAGLAACSGDGTGGGGETGFTTAQPALATALGGATVQPILSVGDSLPSGFVYPPSPDGLGGYLEGGRLVLFNAHELSAGGVPTTDGGVRFAGARVSRLVLDPGTRSVLSAGTVVDGPAGYRNFCSATFAGAEVGLPGGWFLVGEEATGAGKDGMQIAVGKGGQVVEMPWIGRFAHENLVAIPGFPGRVVLAGLDDTRGVSELYLYVAASEADVLAGRGTLYVFTSSAAANVGQLAAGQTIDGRFAAIANAASLTSAQLQAAVDALGAFRFVGTEDGDYDRRTGISTPALYFADTGSGTIPSAAAPWDPFGSIYRLELAAADPTQARLTLLARSPGPAAGWASPDNVGTSRRSLMVQEDPSNAAFARAPRVWRFPLNADGSLGAPQAVAELANPDCTYNSGCWESSGIVDASAWLGDGAWLFDVQAHTKPVPAIGLTRENGQLLYLRVPGS